MNKAKVTMKNNNNQTPTPRTDAKMDASVIIMSDINGNQNTTTTTTSSKKPNNVSILTLVNDTSNANNVSPTQIGANWSDNLGFNPTSRFIQDMSNDDGTVDDEVLALLNEIEFNKQNVIGNTVTNTNNNNLRTPDLSSSVALRHNGFDLDDSSINSTLDNLPDTAIKSKKAKITTTTSTTTTFPPMAQMPSVITQSLKNSSKSAAKSTKSVAKPTTTTSSSKPLSISATEFVPSWSTTPSESKPYSGSTSSTSSSVSTHKTTYGCHCHVCKDNRYKVVPEDKY